MSEVCFILFGEHRNEFEAETNDSQSGTGNRPLVSQRRRRKKRGYTRRYPSPCFKPDRATKFMLKCCFIIGVSSQYQHLSLAKDSRERQAHRQILIGRSGSQPRSNWTSWLSVTPPEHDALTAVNHLACSRHTRQVKRNPSKKVQNVTASFRIHLYVA